MNTDRTEAKCGKFTMDVFYDLASGKLTGTEAAEIKGHISGCACCKKELEDAKKLYRELGLIKKAVKVPPEEDINRIVIDKVFTYKESLGSKLTRFVLKPAAVLAACFAAVFIINNLSQDEYFTELKGVVSLYESIHDIQSAKKACPAVKRLLAMKVSEQEKDENSILNLGFADRVITTGEKNIQAKEAMFLLREELFRKEAERGYILNFFDSLNKKKIPADIDVALNRINLEFERANAGSAGLAALAEKIEDPEKKGMEYYRLGSLAMKYGDYGTAIGFFGKTGAVNAEGAQFNIAWCKKELKEYGAAKVEFAALAEGAKKGDKLFALARCQEADILLIEGEPEKAVALFNEISEKSTDSDMVKMAKFNSAYAYLYEFRSGMEASKAFDMLNVFFGTKGM